MDTSTIATESPARWRNFYPKGIRNLIPLKNGFMKSPQVQINFTVRNLQVKIADSSFERRAAYRLRFDVFYKEFANSTASFGVDRDRFDDIADLLIIKDINTNQVVGTYRLICSEVTDKFYSATEFHLKNFLATPGKKVELSRACIHQNYRKGLVITLLWRGIYEYLKGVEAKYLFGLSSMTKATPSDILAMIKYLKINGHLDDRYEILPLPKYDQSAKILRAIIAESTSEAQIKEAVPPLIRAYLNGGAKLATVPAYDAAFCCYDFLTILDTDELGASHTRKFSSHL